METSQLRFKELADKHLIFAEDNAKAGLVIPAIRNLAEVIKYADLGVFFVPQERLDQIEQTAYKNGAEIALLKAREYTLDKLRYDTVDLVPALIVLDKARECASKISSAEERKRLEARIDELESNIKYYVVDKI